MELHEAAPPPAEVKHRLETPFGLLHAWVSGSPRPGRPALLTFPDVGHTHLTCFSELFGHEEMQEIARSFHLAHLEPPGMEEGAPPYPPRYQYPSLEQLAEALPGVLQGLGIRSIVGVGVGAGAFVLAKFGLLHPEAVEGLVLLNLDPRAKGWMDWAASKLSGLTMSTNEMILNHLFTQDELAAAPPPVRRVREHLAATPNPALLWAMYTSRADLGLERSGAGSLRCPVLLVVGDNAPHEDAVVECNAKLDPTQTSFLKMADGGGQPQIAQPGRLTEAIKYFLQGMGYMAASAMTRLSRSRTGSVTVGEGERGRSRTLSRGSTGGGAAPPPASP
ncbi:protein NDRG2-like [Vidua chalybeata]|uniref:protein NDRG2-like n=1 Tax=Vidua chalybeata TaxID=81927 RepID=UPI0023A8D19C|nr:protein NDRG2-like [Vidua chalybeata]XP_053789250.1 protein NDRG2-like [Vidua chalybeata]